MSFPTYPTYKDSGVEWLGDVPEHWNSARFSRVVMAIKDGTHGTFERVDEGVPLLSAKNVQNGFLDINEGESLISEDDSRSIVSNGFPSAGDLLLTIVGTIGRSCVYKADKPYAFQRSVCFLRFYKRYSPYFFYYFSQSKFFQEQLAGRSKSSAQAGVYMGDVVATSVVFPPDFSEQTQIARFLDHETARIDALIEEQQRLIELLKEKRQAVISHAVTKGLDPTVPMKDSGIEWLGEVPLHWRIGNIKYFLEAIGDVDHYMPQSVDKGIPYVMTGDLMELVSDIQFEECKQVAYDDYLKLSGRIKTSKGDVVMARYATIGSVSYVDIDAEFLVSYSCVTIKPGLSKVLGIYLFYYFKSDSFLNGIRAQTNTNTQDNVGVGDIKSLKIALPSAAEQMKIVDYLQSELGRLDAISKVSLSTISLAREKRSALISAAVTGKIDVRGWQPPANNQAPESVVAEAH